MVQNDCNMNVFSFFLAIKVQSIAFANTVDPNEMLVKAGGSGSLESMLFVIMLVIFVKNSFSNRHDQIEG